MKTYTFPYGTGEWDGTIDVDLNPRESALLEESMAKEEFFHMDEDPSLRDIERKVSKMIVKETKERMVKDGELSKYSRNDRVYEELGNYNICLPNAFDHKRE